MHGSARMKNVLLVEDDSAISEVVTDLLVARGFAVLACASIKEARAALSEKQLALLILDWELPDGNGVEICRHYREGGGTAPVLMLTARRSLDDKEGGFDAGADDYVCKPFAVRELEARIQALMRRPEAYRGATRSKLAVESGKLICDDREVEMPPRELALLEFLMRHPERMFSASELLQRVWPDESETTEIGLRACVHRLKKRLAELGKANTIRSSKSYGYAFTDVE